MSELSEVAQAQVLGAGALVVLWLALLLWLGQPSPPPAPLDLRAHVGKPYQEALAALKAQRPLAVVVAYRVRDSWSTAHQEMTMLPGIHYMGVGHDGAYMDLVPPYYLHRTIKHMGIVGVF